MRSDFEELKRFAIADILSVSGRQKTTETVDMHINTIIDIAFLKGQQASQSKVDELQKRVDAAFRVLSQLNDLDDEAHKRWKREACMFSQGESNAYEHSVRLLEQALKGGDDEAK